jgi:CO dehydrogenase/acetyl-CoA synthase beta subunit
MATMTFKKVVVNHTGACGDVQYVAGVPVSLPENVLAALGEDAYEDAPEEDAKLSYKELQERAKELGLPTNKKYSDLAKLVAEKEAELEKEEKE